MGKRMMQIVAAGCLAAGVASCGFLSSNSAAQDPGIKGQAWLAAPCGNIPETGLNEGCPDRPLKAVFDVLDAEGARIARFESDDNGSFEVALPPGVYRVVLAPGGPSGGPPVTAPVASQPGPVSVEPGSPTEVTLRFQLLIP